MELTRVDLARFKKCLVGTHAVHKRNHRKDPRELNLDQVREGVPECERRPRCIYPKFRIRRVTLYCSLGVNPTRDSVY